MAVMKNAVQIVIADQREYNPGMTATEAIETALRGKLHKTYATDPVSRAYVAVLRHPRQARFDAKEIERHEQEAKDHNHDNPDR